MIDWLVAAILSTMHAATVIYLNRRVPEPYMDELFHVDQTRRYCNGDWWSWNAKITTPPALYFIAQAGFCGQERLLNSALFGIGFVGLRRLRNHWHSAKFSIRDLLMAAIPLALPVLLHSSLLFYTDLLSLMAVVWAFSTDSVPVATGFFALAVGTRQTNVVWAIAYGIRQLNGRLTFDRPFDSIVRIVRKTWPLAILGITFAVFVFWNRGIVLGDRNAHEPVMHLMQPLYFALFCMFSAWPVFLDPKILNRLKQSWRQRPMVHVAGMVITGIIVRYSTMDHPYLLADNRHYTFYIWQRWFRRHWLCPYALVPGYVVAIEIMAILVENQSRYHRLALLFGTLAMLIPAQLLEFRYFIVPFTLWRLSIPDRSRRQTLLLVVELLGNAALSLLTVYMFLERPFRWSHEPDEVQRFMW